MADPAPKSQSSFFSALSHHCKISGIESSNAAQLILPI